MCLFDTGSAALRVKGLHIQHKQDDFSTGTVSPCWFVVPRCSLGSKSRSQEVLTLKQLRNVRGHFMKIELLL